MSKAEGNAIIVKDDEVVDLTLEENEVRNM
jgi:hypothetical protein